MKLTIANKLLAGFFGVALLFSISGVIGLVSVGLVTDSSKSVVEEKMPVMNTAMKASVITSNAISISRKYVLEQFELEPIKADMVKALQDVKMYIQMILQGTKSEEFMASPAGMAYVENAKNIVIPNPAEGEIKTISEEDLVELATFKNAMNELVAAHKEKAAYTFMYQKNIYSKLHNSKQEHRKYCCRSCACRHECFEVRGG